MAHPFHHAVSSARRFGGSPEDYQAIHDWFDETKKLLVDSRHRGLRHHAEGIFLCEQLFGTTITISTGRKVPVRWIGEQHVREDLGHIPTAADWLLCIKPADWMSRAAVPLASLQDQGAYQQGLDATRPRRDLPSPTTQPSAPLVVAPELPDPDGRTYDDGSRDLLASAQWPPDFGERDHAELSIGRTEVEVEERILLWLVEDAGPRLLEALRERGAPEDARTRLHREREAERPRFTRRIDWRLLSEQKRWLQEQVSALEAPAHHYAEGILNLIDAVQDYAVEELALSKAEVYR